ncbi:MAG: permease [Flavipsychrobacter sp.]|jgi:predicted PurR-regulated permease PerM|nr:permease [Flavipsychrobacter sp.]
MENLPVTVRRSIEVLGLCAAGAIVVLGQSVLMPLLMAFFLSLLLMPVFRWLKRRHLPEVLSIALCIILSFIIVGGIAVFLSWQIGHFARDIQTIKQNLLAHWATLSNWIAAKTNYSMPQLSAALKQQIDNVSNNAGKYLQGAMVSLTSIFIFLGLMPIYVFLMIYYRHLLLRFVYLWFSEDAHPKVAEVVNETQVMVKYYLVGLLIQIAYLTVLLGGILLLLGIKHAILIGVIFAILNLIPYLGALIGNLIGVLLTLTTSQEMWQIWAVLGTIAFVQFLDNNILMPRIVGSKVKINALASIVGIIIGGAMAGITGMFLSLPVMALLKIIFDKCEHFKQWGVLLGDDRPTLNPMFNRIFRIHHKAAGDK